MNQEAIFRVMLAGIVSGYAAIRIYYARLALQGNRNFFRPRGDRRQLVFGALFFLSIVLTGIYVVAPEQLVGAALPLPVAWRWFAVGWGLLGLVLLRWVHQVLGKNLAAPGVIQERQVLVTVGPYRWVRHPLYTVLLLFAVVYLLISANWLIGVVWISWIAGTVASMIRDEEAALIEKFGDEYRTYMQHTGRFLPRVFLMRWETQ